MKYGENVQITLWISRLKPKNHFILTRPNLIGQLAPAHRIIQFNVATIQFVEEHEEYKAVF